MTLTFQNGSTDSVLDSPSGSSDGSVNPGNNGTPGQDPNGDVSSDPSGASIVDSSHYITVTGMFGIYSSIYNLSLLNIVCILCSYIHIL